MHSAGVRCAYFTTSLRVDRVSIAFRSEKESVQRRDHANFAPNSREKIAKFPKNFGGPRAQKVRELGQRCFANLRISLQLSAESVCVLMQDKARVQRRDHAKIAKKSGEKFANFRKFFGAPRAEKLRELGRRCCADRKISLHLFFESVHDLMQDIKSTSPAPRSRKICVKIGRKIYKISGNSARPVHKNLRALGHRALRILRSVAESWPSQHCIQIRKKQASGVAFPQVLRPTRAKKMRSSRKISARGCVSLSTDG